MNRDIYLVDNNVLSRLTRPQRASRFLRERCVITRDVLYEARGFADELGDIQVRELSIPILERLKQIMVQIPSEDTSLVDLYDNKGSADPTIVATALVMAEEEAQTLFERRIILVSDDKAVKQLAVKLGIDLISESAFAALTCD